MGEDNTANTHGHFSFPFHKNATILHSRQIGWFEKCPKMSKSLVRIRILFGLLEEEEREGTAKDKNLELYSPEFY